MAKKEIETAPVEEVVEETALEEVVVETAPASKDRKARWEAFLEKAKVLNPVKFAQKEKAGEFKVIPEDFK